MAHELSEYDVVKQTRNEGKLHALLEVTNAVNNNLSDVELYELFKFILSITLGIPSGEFYTNRNDVWEKSFEFGNEYKPIDTDSPCFKIETISLTSPDVGKICNHHQLILPIKHLDKVIAYLFLTGSEQQNIKESEVIQELGFIQTIGNIIVVALENQTLTREFIQKEVLQKELEVASNIQQKLIPENLPHNNQIQAHGFYKPFSRVGGDYYDILTLNDEEYLFCVADVSGKGISAGILMSNFQASLTAIAHYENKLSVIASKLNESVLNNAKGDRFITAFLALYNATTRTLTYINCAHTDAYLINKGELKALHSNATGLGMIDFYNFQEITIQNVDKDALLLSYTDGLSEMNHSSEQDQIEQNLMELLRRYKDLPVNVINAKLIQELINSNSYFKAEIFDDIAMVTCRFP